MVAAAATAATKAALAAATKPVEPKGLETKAVAVVAAAATKAPSAVGHKGGETKAKQAIAAEEDALALEEAAKVWRNKCSTCAKSYHPVTRMLDSLLESIPAKGKLALQAGVLTHTRTPAHPHTRTCA